MSMPSSHEAGASVTVLVSPLICVLTMAIGCSVLDDAGHPDYRPLYIACRMGALGGPIAAVFCVLVSSSVLMDGDETEVAIEDQDRSEVVKATLARVQKFWGLISPYMIGIMGCPIGSAILRAANQADSIRPLSAVRAAAVGGLFTTPIYYLAMHLTWCMVKPLLIPSEPVPVERLPPLEPVV